MRCAFEIFLISSDHCLAGDDDATCLTHDDFPASVDHNLLEVMRRLLCPNCSNWLQGNSTNATNGMDSANDYFLTTANLELMAREVKKGGWKEDAASSSASPAGEAAAGDADTAAAGSSLRCRFAMCPRRIAKLAAAPVGERTLAQGYAVVNANTTAYTAIGLKHFTFYELTVVACQDNAQRLCSHPARTMLRTVAYEPADRIPAGALLAEAAAGGGSLALVWPRPADPNGAVIYYEVGLRPADSVGGGRPGARQPRCVSYQEWLNRGRRSADDISNVSASSSSSSSNATLGGTLLKGLAGSVYRVRVRAVTLHGQGAWTEEVAVRVLSGSPGTGRGRGVGGGGTEDRLTLLAGLSLALLAAVLPLAGCLAWHCRQRQRRRRKATIVTQNPDYWSYTYEPDEWEVPRDQVSYRSEDLLGTGSFGCVYRGLVRSLNTPAARYLGRSEDVSVAVKNVSGKATMRERHEFLQEAAHMKKFRQCAHVVRLIGVVSENVPTLVLMELMENGDLKTCLRNMRPEAEPPHRRPPPDAARLALWCAQIADGMYYLETKKYIHRDLAARNCMVTAEYAVKIGDFGMTRDVYYTDYYKKEGQAPLPIRWMAPESLRDGVFTTASDVWSYGVVLWEICSLASQPFMSRSNEEVLHLVKSGKTLEPPADSPDFMADLMNRCWVHKPRLRASFEMVLAYLDGIAPESFCLVSWYHNRQQQQQQQQQGSIRRAPSNGYVQISV